MDLVELTGSRSVCAPNTVRMAAASTGSLICVPVPWALIYSTASGGTAASHSAARMALAGPPLEGWVMCEASDDMPKPTISA